MGGIAGWISQKLPLLIVLAASGAYFLPVYWQPASWLPSVLLGVVIFFAGLSMDINAFKEIRRKKKVLALITVLKWTLTVSVSVALAHSLFSGHPEIAAGIVLAGTVPSATAATVYTFLAGGNASIVVAASLLDVAISPIVTPIALMGFGSDIALSFFELLTTFLLIVVLPMGAGLFIQRIAPKLHVYSRSVTKLGSSLALLTIVYALVGTGKEAIASELGIIPLVVIATFVQVALPMAAAYILARKIGMEEADARAALFQVGLCNTALAAILAFQFIGELGTIGPIFNMIFNLSLGALAANHFAALNADAERKNLAGQSV